MEKPALAALVLNLRKPKKLEFYKAIRAKLNEPSKLTLLRGSEEIANFAKD